MGIFDDAKMDRNVVVSIKLDDGARLPKYETAGASGMDLASIEAKVLQPGERHCFKTGVHIELPDGYEAQVRPRSGLALKHGIGMVNAPGTIDSDYRGDIGVLLINHGNEPYEVNVGDRIAQLVIARVMRVWFLQENLAPTERGSGGYGSTGR